MKHFTHYYQIAKLTNAQRKAELFQLYSRKENRKEGEMMRDVRQVGYVELINGRQIAYTNVERIGDTVILTLPSGSTITLLDAEIGRWL